MRTLLDPHVLLWALAELGRLDKETCVTIEDNHIEVLFSAVSLWEIATKAGLGCTGCFLRSCGGRADRVRHRV
jgi:PIN domain nuclease of toxin-antitoxin system